MLHLDGGENEIRVGSYPTESLSSRIMTFGNRIMMTTDGTTWKFGDSIADISAVCYEGGKFVALARMAAYTSTDGTNWTKHEHTYDYILRNLL